LIGHQHQYVLQAGKRRVGLGNVGPGIGAGDGAPQKKGKVKTAGHGWRPSSPKAKIPRLPCPRLRGVGRGEGSTEMKERAYTHEKPVVTGSH